MGKFLNIQFNRLLFQKSSYVIINIFSSAILLSRSVFFLKYLDDYELGVLMLIQAVIGIFGLCQIGLFNGGLRVFSIDSYKIHFKNVNNNIVTFIFATIVLAILGTLVSFIFSTSNNLFILLSIIIGGFSLYKNWFTNLLVARKKYRKINILNFWSSVIAAILGLFVFKFGIIFAIISIGALPLSFIILFYILNKEFRPNAFSLKIKTLKMLLVFGFIPYLSGVSGILYNQIDKFFIVGYLSLNDLGQFYLATVFMSVFTLVPNSINNLFTPEAINFYNEKKLKEVRKIGYKYFSLLVAYSFIVYLILILFAHPVINLIFPEKIHQLHYLFILMPGMVAVNISGAFGFILHIALHYKAILWNNIFSLVSYFILLWLLVYLDKFTLENVSYIKSFQGILVFIFLLILFLKSRKKLKNFYYLNKTNTNLKMKK